MSGPRAPKTRIILINLSAYRKTHKNKIKKTFNRIMNKIILIFRNEDHRLGRTSATNSVPLFFIFG